MDRSEASEGSAEQVGDGTSDIHDIMQSVRGLIDSPQTKRMLDKSILYFINVKTNHGETNSPIMSRSSGGRFSLALPCHPASGLAGWLAGWLGPAKLQLQLQLQPPAFSLQLPSPTGRCWRNGGGRSIAAGVPYY
jgi:hypothetical protein